MLTAILASSVIAHDGTKVITGDKIMPSILIVLVALIIWSLAWKGVALWQSARLSHKWWFVVMLIVNTVGLLEIAYLFLVSPRMQKTNKEESIIVEEEIGN